MQQIIKHSTLDIIIASAMVMQMWKYQVLWGHTGQRTKLFWNMKTESLEKMSWNTKKFFLEILTSNMRPRVSGQEKRPYSKH